MRKREINQNVPAFDNSVSIIIPTRNEAENVAPLVSQIVSRPVRLQEILFVDDSTDATRDVIRSLTANYPVRLIEQDHAQPGLAAAVMSGAKAATGTFLLVMDANLSHLPDRIKDLLAPLLTNMADMVIGSRYIPGGSTRAGRSGAACCREQAQRSLIPSQVYTIPCRTSSPLHILDCWISRHRPMVLEQPLKQWCAPGQLCACSKFPLSFGIAHAADRKCLWESCSDVSPGG